MVCVLDNLRHCDNCGECEEIRKELIYENGSCGCFKRKNIGCD